MPATTVLVQSLTRSRLSTEIAVIIQKQIMSGAIAPGAKLPSESAMAESFKVNRTTLREALRRLEHLELIEIRQGDGVYAKDYLDSGNLDLIKAAVSQDETSETLYNIMETRRMVTPEVAALAALRRTPSELDELAKIIENTTLDITMRDFKVNQMIARASHNMVYTVILNFFNQMYLDFSRLYFNNADRIARATRFHHEIYAAIRDRESEKARELMRHAVETAEIYIETLLKEKS